MYRVTDPDEFETTFHRRPCSFCQDQTAQCDRIHCDGSSSLGSKRRPMSEILKIKAERRRREEDDILAQAEVIKARRALERDASK